MRKLFIPLLLILMSFTAIQAQTAGSGASPTLKVGDGTKSFNGVNELRFPVGCVTFSGRTAVITCISGNSSSGAGSSQNGNLFYASPNGSYGLPSWRAIVEADLPAINATKVGGGAVSNTEFSYLDGATSPLQTQLDAKQAALGYTPLNAAGNLSDVGSAVGARANLGLGTAATLNVAASGNAAGGEVVKGSDTRLTDSRAPTAHTHAQSEVTSLVSDLAAKQAGDSDLTALAGLTTTGILTRTATGTATTRTITGSSNITVTDGDGVSGNPTLDLPSNGVTAGTYTNATVTVNAKGLVTAITSAPEAVGVDVRNSTNISITSGVNTVLTFDTEVRDTYSLHSTVTNTSRLTASTSGWHTVTAGVTWLPNGTGYRQVGVRINGANYIALSSENSPSATAGTYTSGSRVIYLTIGEYVEVEVYHNAGVPVSVYADTYYTPQFSMVLNR